MRALSPSGVNLLQTCEFAYDYRYNQESTSKQMTPDYYAGGRLFHRWADTYGKHLITTDRPFDQEQAEIIAGTMPEGVPLDLYEDIQQRFLWWAKDTTFRNPAQTRTEMKLAFDANGNEVEWDSPAAAIRMIIDKVEFIDGELLITDYKTGRQIKPINELAGKTYTYGVYLKVGGKFTKIRYIEEYLRHNYTQELEITEEDFKAIPKFYAGIAKKIEAKTEWGTRVSGKCVDCEAAHVCAAYKAEVEANDLAINNDDEAVALAQKIFTSLDRLGKGKEMLKAYSDVHGAIRFGDQEFGPVQKNKVIWTDLGDLLIYLTDNNGEALDLNQISKGLSLTGPGLAKIFMKTGLKGDDLETKMMGIIGVQGTVKTSTSFTFHKVKT